ncbi:MAG: class A beta-lactamase-related serine hydrolase [Caldilinea sp. CFX5]|nr:class A beta-lactamase-related serine hydrolase [Caldilinea sp. CFX5]
MQTFAAQKVKQRLRWWWLWLCFWLLLCGSGVLPAPARAQAPDAPANLPNLDQFLDATISRQLAELAIPGAAVAVVADGQLLLAKGYGLADREQNRPVDGERTLFRTGSVGKLITWTAVMQFVEQGKLDLHADVNDYLDFTIPATFAEPITLAHLMTHTPGFEDVGEALFVLSPDKMMPLRQYLIELQPARVFPPGRVQAYSNYGTALAGYIVERVSGASFADYVEEQIFVPLAMSRSTLRQPVPLEWADDLAAGYGAGDYRNLKGGFVFMPAYPAGAMSAPAADMARFMLAHLQDGRYADTTILQPATIQAMHRLQYAPDPRLEGMGYGFMRQQVNGQAVLFHRGSTFQFNAALYLLPDEAVGLYVVYNGLGGINAPAQLWQAFMDHYYPAPALPMLTPTPGAADRLAAYTGEYHLARAEFSGAGKIIRLLEAAQVSATADGYLQLVVEGDAARYVEVESGLFRHQEREEYLAFHTGADGTQWLSLDGRPAFLSFTATSAFQVPWYATLSFSALLLLLTLLLFTISSLAWLIGALWRRGAREKPPFVLRLARWLATAFGLIFLIFLVAFVSVMGDIEPAFGVPRLFFGAPPIVDMILLLPWLLALLAAGLTVSAGWLWRGALSAAQPSIPRWTRLHLALLTLLSLAIVWWLTYWNLLAES